MTTASGVDPTVRESGDDLYLVYLLWSTIGERDVSAVLRFTGVCDWHYGYPNDEGLDSHPLYGLGLEQYEFHVTPIASHGERAWIATFHDGTLTVYARSMKVVAKAQAGDPSAAIRSLLGDGLTRNLDD
jgi:hypothetical protein